MYTAELAPGLMPPRHSHPGHYFVYVLEGRESWSKTANPPFIPDPVFPNPSMNLP
jgi:quercetin dioxygenase-like cupin family protein